MKLPIVLIGFMASGKTSYGKKLARKLGLDFVDLDQEIEQQEKQSITDIFQKIGEAYFREIETQTLREILKVDKRVIALGGGTVCHENNLSLVNHSGRSIYLKKSNAQLLGRLRQNKEKRPLVAQLNDEELKEFIQTKMKERAPFYEQAHIIVEEDRLTMEELVAKIKQLDKDLT